MNRTRQAAVEEQDDAYGNRRTDKIKIHPEADFAAMRAAGRLAAECLDMLTPEVKPGVSTARLDKLSRDFILDHGAWPAPYNYRGYPASICTSLNHVICHGIPSDKPCRDGDILNIDVTVILDGWHGDSNRTYLVGNVPLKARRLVEVTYESMMRGIEAVRPGAHFGDIGAAIQKYAEGFGYSVVRDFCGHGLGRVFHDAPNVLHYGKPGTGPVIETGMFFTIEPMINIGKPDVRMLGDGWTAVTRDRSLSAQFEHSVGVTADGVEIFTLSPAGYTKPPYGP
ncbi:type I methionyl aminopeptidase [Zavarzinia sp.]|uniref:type I methionyl aminopeptidase n=1 Tax=Zavarzinia sp. TaxID=2027920 RepID=UPI00356AE7EE